MSHKPTASSRSQSVAHSPVRRPLRVRPCLWTVALLLGLSLSALAAPQVPKAPVTKDAADAAPPPPSNQPPGPVVAVRVPLFFYRKASVIKNILDALIQSGQDTSLKKVQVDTTEDTSASDTVKKDVATQDADAGGSGGGGGTPQPDNTSTLSDTTQDPDYNNVLILIGPKSQVRRAEQIIAVLDLPVPGIRLEMWGFQVSSRDPRSMETATRTVYRDIDDAKSAVHELLLTMQLLAAQDLPPTDTTQDLIGMSLAPTNSSPDSSTSAGYFQNLLTQMPPDGLGYRDALNPYRTQSLSDILLRLVASDPSADAKFANDLYNALGYQWAPKSVPPDENLFRRKYQSILDMEAPAVPFGHLFVPRGLQHTSVTDTAGKSEAQWGVNGILTAHYNVQARKSILDFTYNYADYIKNSDDFSPYYLAQTADVLTTRLQAAADALNQDIEDLILQPTLFKISHDLATTPNVEYAQAGRVEVATLNNTQTTVTGTAAHTFDSVPTLTLPALAQGLTAGTAAPGFLSSEALRLLGAASKNTTVWNELDDSISLDVTPNVLRDATSAELKIHLTVGDQQVGTRDTSVPALSYVSKHEVQDSVYLNALDIFDLSTFSSQATLGGGRAYAPIIGPAWHGVFGDVPVLGDLFSWKKSPKTVYSQSILFASALITPTAMELALLYPISVEESQDKNDQQSGRQNAEKEKNEWKFLRDQVQAYPLKLEKPAGGPVSGEKMP